MPTNPEPHLSVFLETVLSIVVVLLLSFSGCNYGEGSKLTSQLKPVDKQIADECFKLIGQTLEKLPEDHELVKRYGKFVSMDGSTSVKRYRRYEVPYGFSEYPSRLTLECSCKFDRFSTSIVVTVTRNEDGSEIEFGGIYISPSSESSNNGALRDSKLVQKGKDVWFEQNDGSATHCFVTCSIYHPDFEP